ncbi:MAG: hypothetical protein FWH23_01020 [Bacteroidales bacterium]|nr:hypothetical protein [Bacteroidales bacterium]
MPYKLSKKEKRAERHGVVLCRRLMTNSAFPAQETNNHRPDREAGNSALNLSP